MSARPDHAVALVTGASRGIGAAVAQQLGRDGWIVAVNYRNDEHGAERTAHAIQRDGGTAVAIAGDVADATRNGALIDDVEERLGGPVLALVNNAGVRADNLAIQISDDDWDTVLQTNLSAAFRLTRRALRGMLRARFGRVVNIASVVGPNANPGQANYAAAKAGLIGMTKTIAAEVAKRNVTVNAVAPGLIETDMTAGLAPELLSNVPARRAGSPDDVAGCVRFLASDDAAYVTGATLVVDGGLSA